VPITLQMKRNFLRAIKRNYSLRMVKATFLDLSGEEIRDLFEDEEEKKKLKFYAFRNTRLEAWVQNPDLVPRHLWFEAIHLALKAGEDTLYLSLQKTLGSLADEKTERLRLKRTRANR